jgi:RNA polymerase sigma-70 factor, ECF subfamily
MPLTAQWRRASPSPTAADGADRAVASRLCTVVGIQSSPSTPDAGQGDQGLVAAAVAGGREALEGLLNLHYERIHALCRRITGDDEDALDAAQEALIAIARGIDRFDGRSAFSTWVYRVTTNAALDELRRRRRRPVPGFVSEEDRMLFGPPGGREETREASGQWHSARPGRDSADQAVARLDVDAALARLIPEQRAAVVLRDLLDLDYAEIAATLEIPVGTVRSRIARGRAALAELLAVDDAESGNQTPPANVKAPQRARNDD